MTQAPKRLDPKSLDALCEGLLDAGDAARLTEALRRRPGQRSWQRIATDEARYTRIISIAVTFWPNANASECARQFHLTCSRYHGGHWRRDRVLVECPTDLSPLHQQFWHLLKLHDRVLSEERLRHIIVIGYELPGIHDQQKARG
jgi:hypothetical protein